jgi:hypothetical protein
VVGLCLKENLPPILIKVTSRLRETSMIAGSLHAGKSVKCPWRILIGKNFDDESNNEKQPENLNL